GKVSPASSARLFSCALPSEVALKKHMRQVSSITSRFLIVWPFLLPLSYSCCSSRSRGRWIGRSVPSCHKGGTWPPPSSVWSPGGWLTRRPCGPAAVRAELMPDSARQGGGESTCWHSLGTSQRGALALLGSDSVSRRSA